MARPEALEAKVTRLAEGRASDLRLLADQAFSRTAGAPLVAGNAVSLLLDAEENYPAWLEAIAGARRPPSAGPRRGR